MARITSAPRPTAWRRRAVWRSGGAPAPPPRAAVAGRRGRAGRDRTRVGSSPSSKNDNNCSRLGLGNDQYAHRTGPFAARTRSCTARRQAGRRRSQDAVRTADEPTDATTARDLGAGGDARRVLDRYRLVRQIGSGGFGVVWLAEDERLERAVAVKRIAMHDDAVAARAEREARAAARLSHPGIVALYESGRDDEAVYLVSELVRGRTLAELMRDGELSDRDVLRVGVALCDALAHAHGRGVIHRDVKPGNVIVPDRPHDGGGRGQAHGLRRRAHGRRRRADRHRRRRRHAGLHGARAGGRGRGGRGGRPLRAGARPLRGAQRRQPRARPRRRGHRAAGRRAPAGAGAPAPRPPARAVPAPWTARSSRAPSSAARWPTCARRWPTACRWPTTSAGRSPAARSRAWPGRRPRPRVRPRRPRRRGAGRGRPGRRGAGLADAGGAGSTSRPPPGAAAAALAVLLAPRLGWIAMVVRRWRPGPAATAGAGHRPRGAADRRAAAPRRDACGRCRPERRCWAWPAWRARGRRSPPRPAGRGSAPRSARSAAGGWRSPRSSPATASRSALRPTPRSTPSTSIRCSRAARWRSPALWALAALALPVVVRGRVLAADVVGATAWAAALGSATQAVAGTLSWQPTMRGLVAGAVVAGGLAVAFAASRGEAYGRSAS